MFSGYLGRKLTASSARLAAELAAIGHPHVGATLDFSHAFLKMDYDGRREDFVEEVRTLAPWSRHLHDSFGMQDGSCPRANGSPMAMVISTCPLAGVTFPGSASLPIVIFPKA